MSINIKELYKSDVDPASPLLWWSSKKVEKLNWNFDQIELFDGGPYGPQGFKGKTGFEGVTGNQGFIGVRGFQGRQGVSGPKGSGDWTSNTKLGQQNVTIKYIETKSNPSNFRVGYADNQTEYILADTSGTAVKRYNTNGSSQNNLMFIASNIDGVNTFLDTRKAVFFNLYRATLGNATLDSGFQNESNGTWKFRLSPGTGNKFSFLTPKSSPTEMLELSASRFKPAMTSNVLASAVLNSTVQIASNSYYGAAGVGKIATTAVDTNGQLGTVMWKNVNQVLPIFPIGSIIAVDKEFTDQYFNLDKTGIILDLAAVAGYPGTSTIVVPEFRFNFGAGLSTGKFKGWYLCNGKTWQKGGIKYDLPNLCGFDVTVDYPIYNSSLLTPPVEAVGNISMTTANRQFLGSADVGFKATEVGAPGTYTYTNGTPGKDTVKESYIDLGEPDTLIYNGSTTVIQPLLEPSRGKGDGLFYLCFLEEDGFTWGTAGTPAVINTISLSYNASGYGAACSATASNYDCNFITSTWGESNTWTTNNYSLYVSGTSSYAASGWYASGGIARYFNTFTGRFTSRMICPSYTSIQLVYNSAVINTGINGSFSGLSKSTYYIDGSALSNSTGLWTNSGGTTQATAGWYRDSGSRRYWNGTSFDGAIFTENFVHIIDALLPLGYGTTVSSACSGTTTIYGYFQSSSSSVPFGVFSTMTNLFVGSSSAGSGVVDYANSSYNYSDGSISRKCNNSSTGALNSSVSCISSPSGPSGPSGPGSNTGCVLFGTKITINDGSIKQVQDLLIGDTLSSRTIVGLPTLENEKELYSWRSAKLDLYNEDVTVVRVQTYNVNCVLSFNDGKLFTTKDHLHLYKSGGLWQIGYAINIKIGDMLLSEDGKEIEVNSVVETRGNYIVYRVDVEENDMFIANGILTHNKGGSDREFIQSYY
jgi:hypothetical protein